MARVGIQIKFYYEDILFVDSQAYLPRSQAIKIPKLLIEQNQQRTVMPNKQESRSEQKKSEEDDEEMIDENQNDNENDDNDGEQEQMDGQMQDQNQQQNDNELEIEGSENIQYDDDEDDDQDEIDMSSISRSFSNMANFGKQKTKRQKRELDNFIELPNKRPRKQNKKLDQATELIRKQQKQRKRKQYIKKLNQAQEKATFEKILNQTGRKFKQRQQKQLKEEQQKGRRVFGTLGDVPKIITRQNEKNSDQKKMIILHKTQLFSSEQLKKPQVKMGELCTICQKQTGRYKTPKGQYFCSVPCFKTLKACN